MTKKLPLFLLSFFLIFFVVLPVYAQNQTGDEVPVSTDSATATESATSTTSATTSTVSGTPTTLPVSGAHDVLILTVAGIIFLIAGVTALSGVKQVFNEID